MNGTPAEVAQWICGYLGLSEVEHARVVTAVQIRFENKNEEAF